MIDSANAQDARLQRRKAVLCVVLALLGTTTLAGIIASTRRTVVLGVRIAPRGWRISVRPPAHWRALPDAALPDTLVFEESIDGRTRRLALVNKRANPNNASPEHIAAVCLQEFVSESTNLATPLRLRPRSRVSRLGPFPGAIVEDNQNGVLVLAADVDGDAYCIAVIAGHGQLSQRDRQLALSIGSSVEREH